MGESSTFKSSFDNRRKKQSGENGEQPPKNAFDAILNQSIAEGENLSTSQPASLESKEHKGTHSSGNYQSGTERSSHSSYGSNSHEPKTPDDNEQVDDNFELSDFGSNDAESIQHPSDLLLYEPHGTSGDVLKSVESLTRVDLPEYSEYNIDDYKLLEPSLYETVLLHRDNQQHSIENIPIERRYTHYSQDPLSFLMSQEKVIKSHLQQNITAHSEVSKKGLSSNSIRQNIGNCLKSLSSVYESIAELYQKEMKRKSIILSSFEKWEQNKKLLKEKVKDIRSESNKEGYRLSQLLKESSSVDEEIENLEKRLKQLKEKKKVLGNEIAQSQSIIESRTSSYLESLREVEKVEKTAITKLSQERSIESGLSNLSLGFPIGSNNISHQGFGFKNFLMNFSSQIDSAHDEADAGPVAEMIERQIDSYGDCIKDFQVKERSYEEASIIWANVSTILNELEITISEIMSQKSGSMDQTKSKIVDNLTQTQDLLVERLESIKDMNDSIKDLIFTEISILDMGIKMIAPDRVRSNTAQLQKQASPMVSKSPSPSQINPTIAKFTISDKALASSPPHPTLAVGSGSFSSSGSLRTQLKQGLFKNDNTTKDEKQTKRD